MDIDIFKLKIKNICCFFDIQQVKLAKKRQNFNNRALSTEVEEGIAPF